MKRIQILPLTLLASCLVYVNVLAQDDNVWSLQECVDYAYSNNLDVRRAELSRSAEEQYLIQSRHSRVPTLNFNLYQGWNWGRTIDPTTNTFTTSRFSSNGFSGNSSLILFNGMQQVNAQKQGEKSVEASFYELERAKNDVALNVVAGYLEVIFTKELLGNAQYQLENTRAQLERTEKLVNSGSLPKSEMLDLQAQLASNEVNRISAENNVALALLRLKQFLQIPASEPFDIVIPGFDETQLSMVSENAEEVYSNAELTMPEVKAADLRVESALIDEKVAAGGVYPVLSMNMNISTNYSNTRDVDNRRFATGDSIQIQGQPIGYLASDPGQIVLTDYTQPEFRTVDGYPIGEQWGDNLSYGFGFNLRIPIINGHQVQTNRQLARIQKERAEVNAQETRNVLRRTIETAYNDAQAALKTYDAAMKQVEALEESFRATERRYQNRASNYTEYQVANNNLFVAKSDLVRAKYDYIFKLKILDFYLGNPITLE